MKLLFLILLMPLLFLLVSGTSQSIITSPPIKITRAVVKSTDNNPPPIEHPILIRIEHQGFPFDIDGRFPFVVMIDNTVYRADPDAVREFLSKGIYVNPSQLTK